MTIKELYDILLDSYPIKKMLAREDEIFKLIPELKKCKNFEQNNDWHIYDVYYHTLLVVNYAHRNLILRLAALFHDIGKPSTYTVDENGIGHFHGHYIESQNIFNEFSLINNLDKNLSKEVSNLIYYHDLDISKMNEEEINNLIKIFNPNQIRLLFDLKKADLTAQNSKYHYLLNDYTKQKYMVLSKYK